MDIRQRSGNVGDPLPGQTYGGFAAQRPATSASADRPLRTPSRDAGVEAQAGAFWRKLVPTSPGQAVATLLAIAALAGGVMTRLPWSSPSPPGEDAAAPAPAPPAPASATPSSAVMTAEPSPPAPAPVEGLRTAPATETLPASRPVSRPAAKVADSLSRAPKEKADPSATCPAGGDGRPGCPDAAFAALDRRINAAFAAAMRSGAPAGPLGQQQQDWIIRLDRVRREDPGAAKDLYLARLAELRALASRGGEQAQAVVARDASESPQ